MQNHRPRVPRGLAIGVAIIAASTASILIRYAQREASSSVIAAYRLAISTAILAPLLITRCRPKLRAVSGRNLKLTLLAGGFLALHFATWIRSLEFTSVTSSIVLVQTTPLMVAAWAAGDPATGFTASTYLAMVLLALLPQLIAHSTYNWALGFLPAAVVSLALLGEGVGSTVLALLLLGEVPTSIRMTGGGLILAGIALGAAGVRRQSNS